ncbi:MAG: hypothetical protein ACK56F_12745, partial [bacterium]
LQTPWRIGRQLLGYVWSSVLGRRRERRVCLEKLPVAPVCVRSACWAVRAVAGFACMQTTNVAHVGHGPASFSAVL